MLVMFKISFFNRWHIVPGLNTSLKDSFSGGRYELCSFPLQWPDIQGYTGMGFSGLTPSIKAHRSHYKRL